MTVDQRPDELSKISGEDEKKRLLPLLLRMTIRTRTRMMEQHLIQRSDVEELRNEKWN